MKVDELKIFFSGVKGYFIKTTGEEADLGVPFLVYEKDDFAPQEFTGVIKVNGQLQGAIYFSCSFAMLRELAKRMTKNTEPSHETVKTVAGELANIIAGNAQKATEKSFEISVPTILEQTGKSVYQDASKPVYGIPIRWKDFSALMVVGVN